MSADVSGAGVPRRALLRGGLLTGAAAALAAPWAAAPAARAGQACDPADLGAVREPFLAAHQAGIATALQASAAFVALDLRPGVDRAALVRLMRIWTDDAVRLTDGRPALADPEPELAGVPARLTITLGLGIGALRAARLAGQAPAWLGPLPAFRGDRLLADWSGGDLLLQVAAEDPVTVAHAVGVLVRDSVDFAKVRWLQRGFHRPANTAPAGITGRNLMGQVDGTVNPTAGTADFDQIVWARGPAWLVGGTGLVVRRIAMDLEVWGSLDVATKESAMGRRLADGAPLTGGTETTPVDFDAVDEDGLTVIGETAHIRLANSQDNSEKMLRRPYNYDGGYRPDGKRDAGLIFAAYMADVDTQFVPVQRRLAAADVMNLWIGHIGSAVFAVPPGVQPGGFLADSLLA